MLCTFCPSGYFIEFEDPFINVELYLCPFDVIRIDKINLGANRKVSYENNIFFLKYFFLEGQVIRCKKIILEVPDNINRVEKMISYNKKICP